MLAYFLMSDFLMYFLATLIYIFHIYIFYKSKNQKVKKKNDFLFKFLPSNSKHQQDNLAITP